MLHTQWKAKAAILPQQEHLTSSAVTMHIHDHTHVHVFIFQAYQIGKIGQQVCSVLTLDTIRMLDHISSHLAAAILQNCKLLCLRETPLKMSIFYILSPPNQAQIE